MVQVTNNIFYDKEYFTILEMSNNAVVNEFLNTKFPTVESLNSVDSVIHEIEDSLKEFENDAIDRDNSSDSNMLEKATEFLNMLRLYVVEPTDEGLYELDKLIDTYGNVPAITYTRELVTQKLRLIKESQINEDFLQLLNKLNDFQILELGESKNFDDYETKKVIVEKVTSLRNSIDNFKVTTVDFNSHIGIDTNGLCGELDNKLIDIVIPELQNKFTKSLTEKIKTWDNDDKGNSAVAKLIGKVELSEFKLLLQLQLVTLKHDNLIPGSNTTIWAIDCLCDKFQTKFVYHFEGDGETNRIDKPEFAFSYVIGYLRKHINEAKLFFASEFAKCCHDKINGSFSTWFVTSLLLPLKKKFTKEISFLLESENGHLLSHFVNEVKKFDEQIKQEFAFMPLKDEEWGGLTNDLILSRDDVWNVWLQNEKSFVNARFEEIVEMDNAFTLEYDVVENGKTKPTRSAINLKNLLEGITSNYDTLPLKFQLKFLSEVQLKLLNFYFDTLKKGTNALRGIKNIQIDGVSTLERICRIWCSGKYITEIMDKWGDDIIFIELWSALNDESENGKNKSEISFFESVIKGYEREILDKIPQLITGYFERQLNRTMKDYFQNNTDWAFNIKKETNTDELDFVIKTLSSDLEYLKTTVSFATFNSWKLLVSNMVASYFEKNVALANTFTPEGTDKLEDDINKIFKSLQLVESYQSYGRVMRIISVLRTGKLDCDNTKYPTLDDSELSILLMRRK